MREGADDYCAYGDDDRLSVGLLRDTCKVGGCWRILARSAAGQSPVWHMDFDIHTPPELIAAVTAVLASDATVPVEPRPYLRGNNLDDMGAVWQPLADAGWTIIFDEACYLATSSDGVTTLTYAPAYKGLHDLMHPEAWLLEVVPDPEGDPLWCAMFHESTPLHLIAAFTTALVDPLPLSGELCTVPAVM
ncbi:DUF317 domain-containing protein [Streptomyces sp. TS71-3]|uniref:DUF317 domain-containing protein n=1 Tax=Streptomyces sp. TS71-3 TaxID=2733862 RepID=UPI0024B5B037|nr:DUF317 domain-containing protein [Streptomyces sp. TS71-3]